MKSYLRTVNGAKCYYCILKWKDSTTGKWKSKQISTGIPVKGNNKRKADEKRKEIEENYTKKYECGGHTDIKTMLFGDYILKWLEGHKVNIRQSTYESYQYTVERTAEYFKKLDICVIDMTAEHISSYYQYLLSKNVTANTVKHYHANIYKSLGDLEFQRIIPTNPAKYVLLPKVTKYIPEEPYDVEEAKVLINCLNNEGLGIKIAIFMGLFYGMRRSEICGIKWSAIDFVRKTLKVKSTIVRQKTIICEDNTKSYSSTREYPLVKPLEDLLLELKLNQEEYQEQFNVEYDNDYVLKWEDGHVYRPDYISRKFKQILKENNLREIRFHDLRHSCASIVLSLGFEMKYIQQLLGHSDYYITANTYSHLKKNQNERLMETVTDTIFG